MVFIAAAMAVRKPWRWDGQGREQGWGCEVLGVEEQGMHSKGGIIKRGGIVRISSYPLKPPD